jgi:hypothetical protein
METKTVVLSADERAWLNGEGTEGQRLAMAMVLRMAEVLQAPRLLPIRAAHIDGCTYQGQAVVDFAEWMRAAGARVSVPTTMNAISLEWGPGGRRLPAEWEAPARRIADAYLAMGARATFTCAPYDTSDLDGLTLGDDVAFGESNVIGFANSVRGLRTERYGDFFDIAAAVSGRVPAVGLHLPENRRAVRRVRLAPDVPKWLAVEDQFWPTLGYVVGKMAADQVVAVEGLEDSGSSASRDRLKAFYASAASSGAVALAHLVGLTPEARTLDDAFGGRPPEAVEWVGAADLKGARRELSTLREGDAVDVVALGSPHFSPDEFRVLAELVRGRRRARSTRVVITTGHVQREVAKEQGTLEAVLAFGAEVVLDTCILLAPLLPPGTRTLVTNSGKYAHYAPGLLGVTVGWQSLRGAVKTAVAGSLERDPEGDGWWT